MSLSNNEKAFLDMLAWSELGPLILQRSRNGYDVCVGSTPSKLILFTDFSRHPKRRSEALNSDAAGRYQFLGRYWEHYRDQLHLPDFGPYSQDCWAMQLIAECRALDAIAAGDIGSAVHLCRSRWASLPGAGYGQPEHSTEILVAQFHKARAKYS